jgi:hypothetical protein
MKLLGNYQSNLNNWYYNELLSLVSTAISKGDYAGGFSFDKTNLDNILASESQFTDITLPEAGTRSIDEDFNYPLSLLLARYQAIGTEITDFTTEISILIDILNKDTQLLDQLVAAAKVNVWQLQQPFVLGASQFSWSFEVGFGKVGFNLNKTDPNNSVIYSSAARLVNYFDIATNALGSGLTSASTIGNYVPKDLTWIYDTIGFDEEETGVDWAELDFLEDNILLTFNSPQADVILPNNTLSGPFQISGTSVIKGIPIYVRTLLTPRVSSEQFNAQANLVNSTAIFNILPGDQVSVATNVLTAANTNGSCNIYLQYLDRNNTLVTDSNGNTIQTLIGSTTTAGLVKNVVTTSNQANIYQCKLVLVQTGVTSGSYSLSSQSTVNTPLRLTNGYTIDPTSVSVFSSSTYYNINEDFVVTGQGYLTLINVPALESITVTFTEYFPSYQCSVNQTIWSQTIMFDYLRPYPDNETLFWTIPIGVDPDGIRNKLPIVDESGIGTGLYINLTGLMTGEYLLKVYQTADSSTPGKQVQLVIDFGQPIFMNVLNLSSYTNYPVNILSIDSQGFASNTLQNLFTGSLLIEKPTAIRFPTTLISKITLTLSQINYSIKQHQIIPDDYIRRQAINDLQSVIPYQAQEPNILPETIFADGYQYEFGLENISGANEVNTQTTVFISGPYTTDTRSSSITLQADFIGDVDFYLCYNALNTNQTIIDSNLVGIALTPGVSIPFPFSSGTSLTSINYENLYLKMVFRDYNSSVKSFLLQVD